MERRRGGGARSGGRRAWQGHEDTEDYGAYDGDGYEDGHDDGAWNAGHKRHWEETVNPEAVEQEETTAVKKKKRGGKKAREKDLKWKAAHGLLEPGTSGVAVEVADVADVTEQSTTDKMGQIPDTVLSGPHERKAGPSSQKPHNAKEKPAKTAGLPSWIAHPLSISDQITENDESDIANAAWGLSSRVIARLRAQNITHLFPVQLAVLPRLLKTRYSSASIPLGDLCVSAPTGSGKTLAYALPIVESLVDRVIPRVRALIVLPTRDLAAQVKMTFDWLLRGTEVRAVLLTGQTSFASEQSQLVAADEWDVATETLGSSRVDIVIATPGRLIDHLKGTEGFTLKHLRFLVIDEADRLLNQSYQDWLTQVLHAAKGRTSTEADELGRVAISDPTEKIERLGYTLGENGRPLHTVKTHRHPHLSSGSEARTNRHDDIIRHYTPLQKLLFSATLTRNPAKIASLQLFQPTYIAVASSDGAENEDRTDDARYVAPTGLEERLVVCPSAGDKPLMLLHILYNLKATGVLVFTNSVESANRLAALLQIYDRLRRKSGDDSSSSDDSDSSSDDGKDGIGKATVGVFAAEAFSSDLPPATRRRLLASFQSGQTSALICSDVMARGMDLGSAVQHVINYEIPTRIKAYVHRIGRTARAGRNGVAWTILEDREVRWFKAEIGKIDRGAPVARVKVGQADTELLVKDYQQSLKELGELVKRNPNSQNESQNEVESIPTKSKDTTLSSDDSSSDSDSDSDSAGDADSDADSTSSSSDSETPVLEKQAVSEGARTMELALIQAADLTAFEATVGEWW